MAGNIKKTVFFDRDGTLVKDVGYLSDPEDIEILPGAAEAIKLLNRSGYLSIVISNQAAVARGILTEEALKKLNTAILKKFSEKGAIIDDVYYCPHHPTAGASAYTIKCECRKPKPGMILRAQKEHDIDLSLSYMVGDKSIDVEAGKNAGCRSILVLTGYGSEEKSKPGFSADFIANDPLEAVKWILRKGR
ncbi:MAG: HAD family hydrolase [Candidatus Margulisiibacteriota bacterium]